MKPTFLNREKPLFTCMAQAATPDDFISLARPAMFHGADAIGIQLEQLEPPFHNEESYKKMLYFTDKLPVYVTNYRGAYNKDKTDDERMDELFEFVKCAGTGVMVDIMGDLYCPAKDELTQDKEAIQKQKDVIKRLHDMGAEVLMSSHTLRFMTEDEVFAILHAHEERGADVCKIVTASDSEEQLLANLQTTAHLKTRLKQPYLFLSGGAYCKLHRTIGPLLGCTMWLTVDHYDHLSTKDQPLLMETRTAIANMDLNIHGRP